MSETFRRRLSKVLVIFAALLFGAPFDRWFDFTCGAVAGLFVWWFLQGDSNGR